MAERIYYTNPDQLEFEAVITAAGTEDERCWVELDRSAFYPTSGGQLHDTGSLNNVRVIDVVETDTGEVRHGVDQPVGEPGEAVVGRVDGERRWRHRQQHTAQHVLSQVFIRLHNAETVSVHLGEDYGAVELDTGDLSPEQLDTAENEANRLVRESLPVEIMFVTVDEARKLPLRKVPERTGTIRVIKTGDLDWSACGGTHCRNTAQVGVIKIIGTEKLRGHLLVKFLSGSQALLDYQSRFQITEDLAREYTCHPSDLGDKFAKLAEENKDRKKQIVSLQKQLLPAMADELANKSKVVASVPVVIESTEGVDGSMLGSLAGLVAEKNNGVVALFGDSRLVVACAPESGKHAGNIVRELCTRAGLRGGGSPTLAQVGGIDSATVQTCQSLLVELINA